MVAVRKRCHSYLLTLLAVMCFPFLGFAGGLVATNTQSALVAAMAGGGTVTFAFNGTIYLTNTIEVSNDTVLDATGQDVAISGSNSVQILIIDSGMTVSMTNLTLSRGVSQGIYVYNYPSNPNITFGGYGGAISNAGVLQMTACSFISNSAFGVNNGVMTTNGVQTTEPSGGFGGAVYNSGIITGQGCVFAGNSAAGGLGGTEDTGASVYATFNGAVAYGGAFFNTNQATFINCVFSNNTVTGGIGGSWGDTYGPGLIGGVSGGAALCNYGSLLASNNAFALNEAMGGQGGVGSDGAADLGESGKNGGVGGNAAGGGVLCLGGSCILVNDTLWSNIAVGGAGGQGGEGGEAFYGVGGSGGNGGTGGSGVGGSFAGQGGSLLAWNVTAASNSAAGGAGGAGGPGYVGYPDSPGSAGSAGSPGTGQGDCVGGLGGIVTLKNSIFSPKAHTDTNIFGSVTDAGNNISFDNQHSLTNSSSFNGINPRLAPLGNYGGPTPTMALLTGSPAINAADVTDFPATDQRGIPRPVGPAPDIGAVEFSPSDAQYSPVVLMLLGYTNNLLQLAFTGTNGETYRIEGTADFVHWISVSTNIMGASGYQETVVSTTNPPAQFFRAVSP
jgi:hypothetical protein